MNPTLHPLTTAVETAPRKPWWLLGLLAASMLPMDGFAQAVTTIKVGTGGGAAYSTIGAALASIPSQLTKSYELQLIDEVYSENILINKTGSATNTLTIRPSPSASPDITGTVTFGTGSRYVTLNGNSGSNAQKTRSITLRQPNSALPTLIFKDDASYNTVREVIVLGSASSLTNGVVVVGDGTSSGNDRNTLTHSYVSNASAVSSQLPANLVYAANNGSGANDAFTLSNNELSNFTNTGVLVAAGNGNEWTISGNSIFYNLATPQTTAQTGIDFRAGSTANDVTVANNFVGGSAANAAGSWANAGTQNFRGIVMDCGTSTTLTNEVTSNTVKNVSMTGEGTAKITALDMAGGRNVLNGNTVAALTNTGSGGVFNLVSRANTVLSSYTIGSGEIMLVEGGLTEVQGSLTNLGSVSHTGGDILITGNFSNSGSFNQASGDTEIKGNMLNGGLFTCVTGKVKLTGAGAQSVSGGNYFNLEINGGGTKTFIDNATIYSGVQMLSGILSTSEYTLTLASLANLSETEASYVLGRVDVKRTPIVGTVEEFGGVGLLIQTAASSMDPGVTSVSRVTGIAPIGVLGRQGVLRYFDVKTVNTTGVDAKMTFKYFAHELNGIPVENLRFFKSINGGSTWQNFSRSGAGAGFAERDGINNFALARWTLGDVVNPLPVGLVALQAERQGRNALLTWTTASEQNNHGFGIEVSLDGKYFREIGYVAAQGNGNSSSVRNYRFVDAAEGKTGVRYYRLRQNDRDGKTAYYGPNSLSFDGVLASLAAYPTQFNADLTVAITNPTSTSATLRLTDVMGREVWHQEVAITGAPMRLQPICAAGTYVLTATIGGQVLRQRVVRE